MRVKIQFPKEVKYMAHIDILIEHINYGNHVGNDKFLSFCHEARLQYLKSISQDEMNFFGKSLIMSDAELSYKGQVYHGDRLAIEIAAIESGSRSFDFYYKLKNQNEKIVCLTKTGMVYFNYKENKTTEAPKEWLKIIT